MYVLKDGWHCIIWDNFKVSADPATSPIREITVMNL